MGTDLTSFRGNLNGLYEAIKVQTALQKEAKTIKIEQKKIKDEIDTFKTAILEDLKQRDQEGVEFKGLKITIHPKPKRVYFKKADKERLICEALRNCGIEDARKVKLKGYRCQIRPNFIAESSKVYIKNY